ncbi:MAG: hypothetical protein JSW64_07480 [Candidatus Zixiibacteriota bacterium]|nr:MAG: hypothetical protein JSW64_07480 [candidate division Zixibacteria bacterium]
MNRFSMICTLFTAVIMSVGIISANAEAGNRWSVSLWGGYFQPSSDWKQHRYAPNVDQFGGMLHMALDFEYRFDRNWALAFYGQFNGLSTAEWENYVRQQGEYIEAEALMATFGLVVRPHVIVTSVNRTKLEFGFGLVTLSGSERYGGLSYDYDFLAKGSIAFLGAVEHDWLFNKRTALVARIGILSAPKGVSYADGETETVVGFSFSAGIRYTM